MMLRRVLLDTGPLVAMLSVRDEHHRACMEQLRSIEPPLWTCWPVLTEAAWLLRSQPAAINGLSMCLEEGLLALLPLDATGAKPIARIIEMYRTMGVQLADATLLHLAEREGIETIFTLDRQDFSIYRTSARPGAGGRLKIVP